MNAITPKWTKGPWSLEFAAQWPWDIRIEPGVITMQRAAYSTRDKTLEDVRAARGFREEERRAEALSAVEEQEANAHLIAAAPDLAEALLFYAGGEDDGDWVGGEWVSKSRQDGGERARAALRKAGAL